MKSSLAEWYMREVSNIVPECKIENPVLILGKSLKRTFKGRAKHEKHRWTTGRVTTLVELVNRGMSVVEIAKESKTFTEMAIRVKLRRLGYRTVNGYPVYRGV